MIASRTGGAAPFKEGPALAERMRLRRSWTKDDAVVTLAAYFERPAGHLLPPQAAMQRTANQLRVPLDRVRAHTDAFATLDPENPRSGAAVTRTDRATWEKYGDDAPACAMDAEWILEGRKWRPKWLFHS